MSLNTFKRKSVIKHGSRRSGKPTEQNWIYQGPYGLPTTLASKLYQESADAPKPNAGFSLEGSHRNIGRVGQNNLFSRSATPFRGVYPKGNGGYGGQYKTNVSLNITPVLTGVTEQAPYVKPPVLSNRGMLKRRYRWIDNGRYPNNWVQPNYTGNQVESASQGLYIHDKSASNDCYVGVNDTATYEGYIKTCQASEQCQSAAEYRKAAFFFTPEMVVTKGYKMWNVRKQPKPAITRSMSGYGTYTKTLDEPQTASQHTLHIQRKCTDPKPSQKPYPYAVSNGTGVLQGGIRVNPASSCGTTAAVTLRAPPETIE